MDPTPPEADSPHTNSNGGGCEDTARGGAARGCCCGGAAAGMLPRVLPCRIVAMGAKVRAHEEAARGPP